MITNYFCKNCRENLIKIFNFEEVGYAIYEIIYKNNIPSDYKYLEVNDVFMNMMERKENIVGKTVDELYTEERNYWKEEYNKAVNNDEKIQFERYEVTLNKYFGVTVFKLDEEKVIGVFRDITKRKAYEESLELHRLLFEGAHDAVLYIGTNNKIVDGNNQAIKLYGYSYEELLKLTILDIRHSSTAYIFKEQMEIADKDEGGIIFESIHVRKDKSIIPVEVSVRGIEIKNEKLRIHIIRDISARKADEERIIYLANHDNLTGVANRGYLMKELDKRIELALREEYKFGVLLFDIDSFKNINDNYGHLVGDLVLKTTAKRIINIMRKIDFIGRLGGDEFIIILPIKTREDLSCFINRVFNEVSKGIALKDKEISITISIGISICPDDNVTKEKLIKYADESMYNAKKMEGNSYYFHKV